MAPPTEQSVSADSSTSGIFSGGDTTAQTPVVQTAVIELAIAPGIVAEPASSMPASAFFGPIGVQDTKSADGDPTSATNDSAGALQTDARTAGSQLPVDTTEDTTQDTTQATPAPDSPLTPSIHLLRQLAPLPPSEMPLAGQPSSTPARVVPSAAHAPVSSSPAHVGVAARSTPLPAEKALQSTQSQTETSFPIPSVVASRPMAQSGDFSSATNLNLNIESKFSPNAAGAAVSSAAAPAGTSAAEPIRQADTSSGDPSDSSSAHKEPAAPAANQNAGQTADPQAGPPQSPGNAVGPATQAAATGAAIPGAAITGANVLPATSGAARASDGSAGATSDSPANLPAAPELPGNPSAGPVQMAQMANQAAQSEMRIGMNTAAFGNVEVRTVVHANDIGVVIGSEKGDLRGLLANELPGIASTLQQQNLRLHQVSFHATGFAFSGQTSSGGDSQSRSFSSARWVQSPESIPGASAEDSSPAGDGTSNSSNGLNIIA